MPLYHGGIIGNHAAHARTITMAKAFNFYAGTQYNETAKRRFSFAARGRLHALAAALGLAPGTYDVRWNAGGIAVSGEATLHGDHVYVQVSQPFYGEADTGVLYRRCKGRRDYTGGTNRFAALAALNSIDALAAVIERDLGPCYKRNADEV
jgi:hypothetical protein